MNNLNEANRIISLLESKNYFAICPCCNETIPLKKSGLFFLEDFTDRGQELYNDYMTQLKEREKELKERKKSISIKSEKGAKAVNIGFILERIAPSMKDFKFEHNDCRSIFDPIDYIIFEGLNKYGIVNKIIFSDIKTGKASLTKKQKEIRDLVLRKKVAWDTYDMEEK